MLSSLPTLRKHELMGLFREPCSNVLPFFVGAAPSSPQILPLICMEGQESSTTLGVLSTFKQRQPCCCLQMQERKRSIFIPQFPGGTKGWHQDENAQVLSSDPSCGLVTSSESYESNVPDQPLSATRSYTQSCHLRLENCFGFASSATLKAPQRL